MRIGFIGAGLMGHGMVLGLLKAGHEVSIIAHRNRTPIDDLAARGATEVKELPEMAHNCDFLVLCLSNSTIVEQAISALKPHLRPGQTIIDTSTSEPKVTKNLAEDLAMIGVDYADAPLTGGPEQAAKSELGILCGANEVVFEKIQPLLSSFASTINHMGPIGAGHTAKLISNYLVTGMVALVSETFAAARETDVDWRKLYEAILNGSGNSGVLRKMVEPALAEDFEGYKFSLDNAFKDIGYYKSLRTGTQLANAVEEFFSNAVSKGLGSKNVSHLLKS